MLAGIREFNARRFDRALAGSAPGVVYISSLFPKPLVGRPEAVEGLEHLAAMTDARFAPSCVLAHSRMVAVFLVGHGKGNQPLTNMMLNEFDDAGERIQILESFDPANREGETLTPFSSDSGSREKENIASVIAGIEAFGRRDYDRALADISPEIVYESNLFPRPIVGLDATRAALGELAQETGVRFQPTAILAAGEAVLVFLRGKDEEGRTLTNMVLNRFNVAGKRIYITECMDPAGASSRRDGTGLEPSEPKSSAGILSAFPPGVDPTTYRLDLARDILSRVTILPLLGEPRGDAPAEPILEHGTWVGGKLALALRGDGAATGSSRDSEIGHARLSWLALPESAAPRPGRTNTPIAVDAAKSQRMLVRGTVDVGGKRSRGFDLFGTGRTSWPSGDAAVSGALLEVRGRGDWAGLEGLGALTALSSWHEAKSFGLLLRVRTSSSQKSRRIPPPSGALDLEAGHGNFYLQGQLDPEKPFVFDLGSSSGKVRAQGHEQLRAVTLPPDNDASGAPTYARRIGEAVGAIDFEVFFDAFGPRQPPLPFQTRNATLRFSPSEDRKAGALRADIIEGRAFPVAVPGLPLPAFRFGGLAPIQAGEGAFAGARGIMIVASWLSIYPSFIDSIFCLRLMQEKT